MTTTCASDHSTSRSIPTDRSPCSAAASSGECLRPGPVRIVGLVTIDEGPYFRRGLVLVEMLGIHSAPQSLVGLGVWNPLRLRVTPNEHSRILVVQKLIRTECIVVIMKR